MTQQDIAKGMDVSIRSNLEDEAEKAVSTLKSQHRGSNPVCLRYYRTQDELDLCQLPHGLDRPVGYVNAIARRIVYLLRESHIDLHLLYPEQMELASAECYLDE